MESKTETEQAKKGSNINIDINGDQDESGVKSLSLDGQDEGRVGLSKEELMKFAMQPFWVRMRNILFASFWIVWLSILVVAVCYVVYSPKCNVVSAAPTGATTPAGSG